MPTDEVDFVLNCYEKTYRKVLTREFMDEIVGSQSFPFTAVTVLVNNVSDRSHAEDLRAALLGSGSVVTRVEFVADHVERALHRCGLKPSSIRRLPHFTDCVLVACTLPGAPWLCYWDADARLQRPQDWISPVLAEMVADPRHLIGNPDTSTPGLAEAEAHEVRADFAVGFGVSDHAFLARRADVGQPIYRRIAPASWRYPLAAVEPVWEQRVDAYMRWQGRTRLTRLGVRLDHVGDVGTNYPSAGPREGVRGRAFRRLGPLAGRVSAHPVMRAWPE